MTEAEPNLPRIIYHPGHYTEETLRQIREEERTKQRQANGAYAIKATATGEIRFSRKVQTTG
jgi:hypothetical protein